MYRALESFATQNYDVKRKQILADDFTTQDEIQEFLRIGYIEVYDSSLEIIENGIYDVEDYETADVNVPSGEPTLQDKSVTITENGTTTVSADSGYDGLNEVSITTNVSGGGVPTITSFNDIETYTKETFNKVGNVLNEKINQYPVYTENAITLYTPSTQCLTYIIHKRSSGKYRIIWGNLPYIVVNNNTSVGFRNLTIDSGYSAVFYDMNNINLHLSNIGQLRFYYSNEFDTPEDVINAITSPTGNITYTNSNFDYNYGAVMDSPYEITYSNTNIFDLRNNSAILMSQRISKNETIVQKS